MSVRGKNGHDGLRGGSTNPDGVIDFQAILPPALPNHKVTRSARIRPGRIGLQESQFRVQDHEGVRVEGGKGVGSRLTNGHYFDSISHSRSFRRNVSKGSGGPIPFPVV